MMKSLCFAGTIPVLHRPYHGQSVATSARRSAASAPPCRRVRAPTLSAAPSTPINADPNDVLLGEFVFTEPDQLPSLVEAKVASGELTDAFYTYVEEKVNASADLEERETLRILSEAVKQLVGEVGAGGSGAGAGVAGVAPVDETEMANATYEALLARFVAAAKEDDSDRALPAIVDVEYESIDKRFLDNLEQLTSAGGADAKALEAVSMEISKAMSKNVAAAAQKLKNVVSAGPPDSMKVALETLAAKGGLDDAFLLLLQGNIQQAQEAGAEAPAKILGELMGHARFLKDARLDPEVRLIRKLLRTDDPEARIEALTEALTPKTKVLLVDGSKTSGVRVNGKKFVIALRKLIEEYSNVEESFAMLLSTIGEESEAVARKLFDMEEKDVKDLQEEAFHKRSVSVWDLEQVEMRESVDGKKADWEGRLGAIPEGFDEHGKMTI